MPHPAPPAPGARITVRGEDFLVHEASAYSADHYLITAEGTSELVQGQRYTFDTQLDDFETLAPEHTQLVPDTEGGYRKLKLHLETQLRNAYTSSERITIADKGALDLATYQLEPAIKALKLPRARLLIADGVGLGKTIEVGILLAELMKRGRAERILVLALKSILGQFQQEIWNRFSIPLVQLDSLGVARINSQLPADKNPFDYFDKTIISIDTLKNGQFKHYIEQTRWDVIVIDECHTVANPASQRGKLAQVLSRQCDSLILTSATPHNGKRENFANLMTMLEPTAVPRSLQFDRETIDKYFVRRFKKDIDDPDVQANFQDRRVEPTYTPLQPAEEAFLSWQQQLKARELAEHRVGNTGLHRFFSIILFKAYLSSPAAAHETLSRKLDRLSEQLDREGTEDTASLERQYDSLEQGLRLLDTVLSMGSDSKLRAFIATLNRLGWRGGSKDERIVVFAERIATLTYLETELTRAFDLKDKAIQRFDGSMNDVEQQRVIEDFGTEDSPIRLFLTSDAGAQGVNLHYFCHRMFNYDLPWSIITLDQRNGRIDRYGQRHTPVIHYLLAESSQEGLRSDLHILDRIREKEEEVRETMGTVGTVLQLFDAEREEQHTGEALLRGATDFLDQPAAAPSADALDLDALLAELNAGTATPTYAEDLTERDVSFYPDDFAFYRELLEFLQAEGTVSGRDILIREDYLEVSTTEEMQYLLEGMPREAKPERGRTFQLTADRDTVMQAIAEARKKTGTWAQFQLLYDLHPLARFWMTKLEARIPKGQALVAKVGQLPAGYRSYVFHGQVTNNLGRNVLSDFFVITINAQGQVCRQPESLESFLIAFRLTERLIASTISDDELTSLQEDLGLAIGFAKSMYMKGQQAQLQQRMTREQATYKRELNDWFKAGSGELDLDHSASAPEEDRSILDERSRFVQDMTSLTNEPFLRVLGVFMGAGAQVQG